VNNFYPRFEPQKPDSTSIQKVSEILSAEQSMNAIDALMQLLPLCTVPKLPTTTSYFEFSSELLLVRVSNVGSDRCNCQGNIRRVSDGP